VEAARGAFWPMLLIPKLAPEVPVKFANGRDLASDKGLAPETARAASLWQAYVWGEQESVQEQLFTDRPARWLPAGYASWEDFLAAVVKVGLRDAHAPSDLSLWQFGRAFPIDLEHPIFSRSALLQRLVGVPTGTGPQPKSGDRTTVRQVDLSFGPSERFTADFGNLDGTTLNLAVGQSGNPVSPWYLDQFGDWLGARTYAMPFTPAATQPAVTHTLTLRPQ
jgi:penicillin amidase